MRSLEKFNFDPNYSICVREDDGEEIVVEWVLWDHCAYPTFLSQRKLKQNHARLKGK